MHRVNRRHWSPVTDYALLLGSGAGAIASLATQNAAIASLPVTALVALSLLNRRRVDQYLKITYSALGTIEENATKEVAALKDQVSALPTPETITSFQRAVMNYSDRTVVRFSQALEYTKQDLEQRINLMEGPDLSHLYQDTAQLQDQYTYVCTTLNNLSKQVDRLYNLPRLEAAEADVSQLKTEFMQMRVNLETLKSESKTAQTTLQDAIRHLDRRLRQLPSSTDPNLLKGEVRELTRAVSDLVPRRDFAGLAEKLYTMQETQESLRQTIDHLQTSHAVVQHNGHAPAQQSQIDGLESEFGRLTESLRHIEARLEALSIPFDITAEIRATTATYLSGLQWQLALLEQQAQELAQQQAILQPASSSKTISQEPEASFETTAAAVNSLQWLTAFRGDAGDGHWSDIDRALFQAFDNVTERLVLVWPWSPAIALDERLLTRFAEVLEGQRRLEIGWCHPGDRHTGQLLKRITHQWQPTTSQRQALKATLKQLLPLRQNYPEQFSFKILGTHEQFLVCDRSYAIIGLQALPSTSRTVPELDLRIKTTETGVIDQLLHRFDHPDQLSEDAAAYFNRAVTRYDLRDLDGAIADFSRVLKLEPGDAVAANYRGIIWVERHQYQRALKDFNQALHLDPRQYAAWCNRGWLFMQQGHLHQATADFEQAMAINPLDPIPYFYRGTIQQKLGHLQPAIASYTQAIQASESVALPYCYRGAAYQHQGDIARAVMDLEVAASLLHAKGEHQALAKITRVLSSLKQIHPPQPKQLHSTQL